MKCPRDGTILESIDYESGIYADYCSTCDGIWLDKSKLEKIEEIDKNDYTEELSRMPDLLAGTFDAARQKLDYDIPCPKCGVETEKTEYAYCSQIIINKCPDCGGIWLDKYELKAIEIFFERLHMESRKISIGFLRSLLKSEEGGINKK